MKRIILPLLLMSSPVLAENSILSCFFKNNKNEHLVVIGEAGNVKLQWGGGPFSYGVAEYNETTHNLIISQYGSGGTFHLIYNADSGEAYGGTRFYDGHKFEGPAACTWQK